jgi:hypothetical protein
MKYFSILGERNSGTNFLSHALTTNFFITDSKSKYVNKHFWKGKSFKNSDDVLFVGIVRNPLDWINSMYKNPHHFKTHFHDKHSFLYGEFWSEHNNVEIMNDRHLQTGNRYHNIIECRCVKLDFLLHVFPSMVKHFILIRYEDLRDDYKNIMTQIGDKFNLKIKNIQEFPISITYNPKTKKMYKKNTLRVITRKELLDHPYFNTNLERTFNYL